MIKAVIGSGILPVALLAVCGGGSGSNRSEQNAQYCRLDRGLPCFGRASEPLRHPAR